MKRACCVVLVTLLAACAASEPPETTAGTTSSTTTTVPATTTTTTPATTTTTLPTPDIAGADAGLTALVTALYQVSSGGSPPPAPDAVIAAFRRGEGTPPATGRAAVAEWDEHVRLAVVEAGEDLILAVADPEWRVLGGKWPSLGIEPHLGSYPKIVAVVGSDARPGERRDAARADSIHFVGLDGNGGAAVVGVPRDAWVPIPGRGNGKINASLAYGGPDMMMGAFSEMTGLEFDGFLLTGFAGFQGLIDVLGGLQMNVPRDFNDRWAKAYIQAGEQLLSAADALALARTRKTIPGGDFQRQEHGGLVMIAAQAMLRANGPLGLPGVVAGARPHLSTDLYPGELLVLAAAITEVDPDQTVNVVAPGGVGTAGSASVVFLRDSAQDLWADLADGSLEHEDD